MATRLLVLLPLALALVSGVPAAAAVTASLSPTGVITISDDLGVLGEVAFTGFGAEWAYATQRGKATRAEVTKRDRVTTFRGEVPFPDTEAPRLLFTETVEPVEEGLRLRYAVRPTRATSLNGVQASLFLPATRFAEKPVEVKVGTAAPRSVALPRDPAKDAPELLKVLLPARKVQEAVADAEPAAVLMIDTGLVGVRVLAADNLIVQDTRPYEGTEFELRMAAFTEDHGREVLPGEEFAMEFVIVLPGPVQLEGPSAP
jgi:hypothetical protein